MSRGNGKRGRLVPTLALATLLTGFTAWQFGKPGREWYSSPIASRERPELMVREVPLFAQYFEDRDFAPLPFPSPDPLKASEVTTQRIEDRFYLAWNRTTKDVESRTVRPSPGGDEVFWTPPYFLANLQNVVEVPDGVRCRILAACMGYNPFLREEDRWESPPRSSQVLVRGSDWKPITQEEFRELQQEALGEIKMEEWNLTPTEVGTMGLELLLLFENIPDFGGLSNQLVWDWNTLKQQRSGSSSAQMPLEQDRVLFWKQFSLWALHPAEMALFFVAAHGPEERAKAPLEVGAPLQLSGLEGEILALERFRKRGGYTVKNGALGGGAAMQLQVSQKEDDELETHIFWSLSPVQLTTYSQIELETMEGEIEPEWHGLGRGNRNEIIGITSTNRPLEELSHFHVRFYPNQFTAVFHLPPLLGVPEENRSVTNLFDVVVPHARFYGAADMEQLISQLAQVEMSIAREVEFPEGYFPKQIEGWTVGEILNEYLAHYSDGKRTWLDPVDHRFKGKLPFSFNEWRKEKWRQLKRTFPIL